jgi:hypothetical protein
MTDAVMLFLQDVRSSYDHAPRLRYKAGGPCLSATGAPTLDHASHDNTNTH